MLYQLEAFKIGSHFTLRENRLFVAIVVASVVGAVASMGVYVAIYHRYQFKRWGVGEFQQVQNWIAFPQTADLVSLQHMRFGVLFMVVLTMLKRAFLWWSFDAVGYAVGDVWTMDWLWFSIFGAWFFERLIFASGGIRTTGGRYRFSLVSFLDGFSQAASGV